MNYFPAIPYASETTSHQSGVLVSRKANQATGPTGQEDPSVSWCPRHQYQDERVSACSGCESGEDSKSDEEDAGRSRSSQHAAPRIGDSGVIDGVRYVVRSERQLRDLVKEGRWTDVVRTCTSRITNMSGMFRAEGFQSSHRPLGHQ
jgi:hypothetical protein